MKIPGLLLEPEDYERLSGRSFQDDFDERKKRMDAILSKKNSKTPIPTKLKWAVWLRDNFTCQHCGARTNLSVDHIHPESKGGEATMENCQTLCKSCNSRKGAR